MDDRDEFLWVVVSDDEGAESAVVPKGGMFDDVASKVAAKLVAARQISVAELEQKMSRFLAIVGRLFRQAEQQANLTGTAQPGGKTSHLRLDEVEMAIEITASGEVKLIAGGKAETKGSIKLKFKRVDG
jgi:hypothetical protein